MHLSLVQEPLNSVSFTVPISFIVFLLVLKVRQLFYHTLISYSAILDLPPLFFLELFFFLTTNPFYVPPELWDLLNLTIHPLYLHILTEQPKCFPVLQQIQTS